MIDVEPVVGVVLVTSVVAGSVIGVVVTGLDPETGEVVTGPVTPAGLVVTGAEPDTGVVVAGLAPSEVVVSCPPETVVGDPVPAAVVEGGGVVVEDPAATETLAPLAQPAITTALATTMAPAIAVPRRWRTPIR